ncbi:polysaccharide lyase family 7 protein [Massariosphaeria phaeospora]|uniref:Polysaccharide lyase family 7 protein n=1 Tax=Massariosphaeria phaeospora TaxID=100035 RepID=A0A7C8MJ38_9PLEO|nr:polysaccharide lyase family 7 protein [Massariosphaeria phaeospora]
MAPIFSSTFILLLGIASAAPFTSNLIPRALDPKCAPGGNFDLSKWNLQLPTGSPGKVDSVSGAKLAGCSGWKDEKHFHTGSDGALITKVPGSKDTAGCVTTPNSKHCRTELREAKPDSWSPKGATNRLNVQLQVQQADDSKYGTVIGQVKVDDSVSKKPLCELFYSKDGTLTMGVSQIPDVSSLKMQQIGKVPLKQKFGFEIRYEKSKLTVSIDGDEFKTLGTGSIDSPPSYFKAGNYNQGDSPSEVHFYAIDVQHS